MANQVTIDDVVQLAEIESAQIFTSQDTPRHLLEVVAQRAGFNWELHIGVPEILISDDYWPYRVVEVKKGPDWPKIAGHGPVIPKTTLYHTVTRLGKKGIEVIGSNKTITLDIHQ